MLRKLVRLQPILGGTLLALVCGYLLGRLMLSRFDEGPPPLESRVVLPAEHGLHDPSIPPIRLHGRLTAADGPLAGTLVLRPEVTKSGVPPGRLAAAVDGDGRFTIEALHGPGAYVALFESAGGAGAALPFVVEIPLRLPQTDELTLELELPDGRVVGAVLDAAGAPLAGVVLELRRYGSDEPFAAAETDATGGFGFRCLPRDVYTLSARREGRATVTENVHLLDDALRSVTLALE